MKPKKSKPRMLALGAIRLPRKGCAAPLGVAASLVIHDAARMTPKGRREVAAWIRRQATYLQKYRTRLAPTFVARYYYSKSAKDGTHAKIQSE